MSSKWDLLRHPRQTWRRLKSLARVGEPRILIDQELEFLSGLGDSAWVLYGLVRSLKPDVCVEIGSARGKSACVVGLALKENGHGRLYAIDPHASTDWNDTESVETYDLIRKHLAAVGVQDQVEIVRSYSDQAAAGWKRRIDVLFIDGDHTYEGVKRDWDLFVPHVPETGVVIFHDTAWSADEGFQAQSRPDMGVPRFVDELRRRGYPVLTLMKDFGVSLVQPCIGGKALYHEAGENETAGA
ncbi:MAG: class I SAM-dependent methyltransferase [Isosphaeraceae bacterium]